MSDSLKKLHAVCDAQAAIFLEQNEGRILELREKGTTVRTDRQDHTVFIEEAAEVTQSDYERLRDSLPPRPMSFTSTNAYNAVAIAIRYGSIDGAHHKAWVIDQMVRILAGERYAEVVAAAKAGDNGPDTYTWDTGIAP